MPNIKSVILNGVEYEINDDGARSQIGNLENLPTTDKSSIVNSMVEISSEFAAMVGTPLVANTSSSMSDQTKIYVYTGSETGYTAGHWYYWNGSSWADGGVYNSGVADNSLSNSSTNPVQNKIITQALSNKIIVTYEPNSKNLAFTIN